VPWRSRQRLTEPLVPSPRRLTSTIPPSLAALRHPSSSRLPISSVRKSRAGGVASSSPSALVEMFIRSNGPERISSGSLSPIHFRTCRPKSFFTTVGLGELGSSGVGGVNGIEIREVVEDAVDPPDGDVRIDR
jgi:hypothetical protein